MELRRRRLTPGDIASYALKLQETLAICAARDKRNRGFESRFLQRRVNELLVPLDEGVFEPPDLLQTRMNGGDQIVVKAFPDIR